MEPLTCITSIQCDIDNVGVHSKLSDDLRRTSFFHGYFYKKVATLQGYTRTTINPPQFVSQVLKLSKIGGSSLRKSVTNVMNRLMKDAVLDGKNLTGGGQEKKAAL